MIGRCGNFFFLQSDFTSNKSVFREVFGSSWQCISWAVSLAVYVFKGVRKSRGAHKENKWLKLDKYSFNLPSTSEDETSISFASPESMLGFHSFFLDWYTQLWHKLLTTYAATVCTRCTINIKTVPCSIKKFLKSLNKMDIGRGFFATSIVALAIDKRKFQFLTSEDKHEADFYFFQNMS